VCEKILIKKLLFLQKLIKLIQIMKMLLNKPKYEITHFKRLQFNAECN